MVPIPIQELCGTHVGGAVFGGKYDESPCCLVLVIHLARRTVSKDVQVVQVVIGSSDVLVEDSIGRRMEFF